MLETDGPPGRRSAKQKTSAARIPPQRFPTNRRVNEQVGKFQRRRGPCGLDAHALGELHPIDVGISEAHQNDRPKLTLLSTTMASPGSSAASDWVMDSG